MLSDNQSIFLYTDGITEATNEKDELFGENKLEKFYELNLIQVHLQY